MEPHALGAALDWTTLEVDHKLLIADASGVENGLGTSPRLLFRMLHEMFSMSKSFESCTFEVYLTRRLFLQKKKWVVDDEQLELKRVIGNMDRLSSVSLNSLMGRLNLMGPMEVRRAISHLIVRLVFCMRGIIHLGNVPAVGSYFGQ